MKRLCLQLLLSALIFGVAANARELTYQEKMQDLDQLIGHIRSGYGPLEFKKQFGIDVNDLRRKYAFRIAQSKTNGEFYYLVVQFVSEFEDSHFSARVPTSHFARLGFYTDLVDGKVVIEDVDRQMLPESDFPFERGDELVSMDGRPIEDVLSELSTYVGQGYKLTSLRKAAGLISTRFGSVVPVPTGKTTVTFRQFKSRALKTLELEWQLIGQPLDEFDGRHIGRSQKNWLDDLLAVDDLPRSENSFRCSGSTRIHIPADATVIMREPFVAYYHPTSKGNVGYLRIPHYYPMNKITGESEYDLRYDQYKYAVSKLEENTKGLIIDQDHNCGGSVNYLERMLGLFMHNPYGPMQFTFRGTKSFYLGTLEWFSDLDPNTLEYERAMNFSNIIKTAWEKGDFMTEMTSFSGLKYLFPETQARYTKPIVMLIDELSGSGGDAFPAHMQGYGRAKLFGTRTMGAGGHVTELPRLNNSQLKVRMTRSLFYRPDGVAVENNGAVPDFNYTITVDDYVNGYKGYQQAYLKELLDMI